MAESAISTRPAAQASAMNRGSCLPNADVHRPPPSRWAEVVMGDIGEEITEIELEPLPEEVPAGTPAEPAEPAPA